MQGWVKLHRSLANHELWLSEKFTKGQAWVDLLMLANHTSATIFIRGNEICITRGQLCWSQENLGLRWRWHRATVSRYLRMLELRGMLHVSINALTSIITILNYDRLQSNVATQPPTDCTTERQQNVPQNDNRTDTNKNGKNDINDNHDKKETTDEIPEPKTEGGTVETKKPKRQKKVDEPFVLPEKYSGNADFMVKWDAFQEHRIAMKDKMTEYAKKCMITKLDRYPMDISITALQTAIDSCWRGVFPESVRERYGKQPSKTFATEGRAQPSINEITRTKTGVTAILKQSFDKIPQTILEDYHAQ